MAQGQYGSRTGRACPPSFHRLAAYLLITILAMLMPLDVLGEEKPAVDLNQDYVRAAFQDIEAVDPYEPNDEFATAAPVSCPSFDSLDTEIGPTDVDYYLVSGTPGLVVLIDIDAEELGLLDSILGAFDSSYLQIGFSDDNSAPGESVTVDSYLEVVMPSDGELFVAVSAFEDLDFDGSGSLSSGPYVLSIHCPAALVSGDLLGSTGRVGGALIDIDPLTGAGSLRASHGEFGSVTEIEFRDDGLLFGATGGGANTLITIDPATGVETVWCSHAPGAINGLEFANGSLYGAYIESSFSPSSLVIVGEPDVSGQCPLTTLGSTGFGALGGLAFDEDTQTLYASGTGSGGNASLFTCDTTSGACTEVGSIGFAHCPALEFGPTGILYGAVSGFSPVAGNLITIDPVTGAGTDVGPTGFPAVSGLAFVPDLCLTPPVLCDAGDVLCDVTPGGVPQSADFTMENLGAGYITNVLGVDIQHNDRSLRGSPGADQAEQLINRLSFLGTVAEEPGSDPLTLTDTVFQLDPFEVVGYLATAEALCDGEDGPLGHARGTVDASSLPPALP